MKTFVFTDLAGSTALKSRMPGRNDNERARAFIDQILKPHLERLEEGLRDGGGQRVKNIGDGHLFVFEDVVQAAEWAVSVQKSHLRGRDASSVQVKIGIHVGDPAPHPEDPNDFIGKPLDYAARLTDHATGGQILVSRQVMTWISDQNVPGLSFHDQGERYLAGIGDRLVFELVYPGKSPQATKPVEPVAESEKDNFPTDDIAGYIAAGGGAAAADATNPHSEPSTDVLPVVHQAPTGAMMSLVGTRLGQYELSEMLGSGGMGDVYLAQHIGMGRRCAVKVIKKELVQSGQTELVDRFYREIKAAGDLRHPNIVVAYDSSTPHDAIHYLVMEYVKGVSLDTLIQRTGPLRIENACELIRQAALGLQCLHQRKMVHRDIKPSNLMLAIEDSHAVVKLLDLGLALLVDETDERLTEFQHKPIGTGMFMAPEQWENTSVDIRADIYSLGCTMYHLLAGHPPFKFSRLKQQHAHQTEQVPRIRRDTAFPKQLWAIQKRMLAKQPADRFATPQEVAEALGEFSDASDLKHLFEISAAPTVEAGAATKKQDTRSSHFPDSETQAGGAGSQPSQRTAPRTPWGRAAEWATRPWVAGLILLLLLGAVIASIYLRDDPISPAVGDETPLMELPVADRAQAINFLATLPGLNGQWWYYEIPWYTPRVRMQMLYVLNKGEFDELKRLAAENNEDAFYTQLKHFADRVSSQNAAGDDWPAGVANAEYGHVYRKLREHQPNLLQRGGKTTVPHGLSDYLDDICRATQHPADYHLLAILRWREGAPGATALFEKAILGYQQQSEDAISQRLLARCYADQAFTVLGTPSRYGPRPDWKAAQSNYESARGISEGPGAELFHLFTHVMQAECSLFDTDKSLADVTSRLKSADILATAETSKLHPMRAFLYEKMAKIHLESWDLESAITRAEDAEAIRKARINRQASPSGLDDHSRHARYMHLRDKQIAALAHHFVGRPGSPTNSESALGIYVELLQLVDDYVKTDGRISDDEAIVLNGMRPNLFGRKSDCEFYLLGDLATARASLGQARQKALDSNFEYDHRIMHLIRYCYRDALISALMNDLERVKQQVHLANKYLGVEPDDTDPLDKKDRYNRFFRGVALAMLVDGDSRQTALTGVLDRAADEMAGLRRDDRQLLLLVCEFLLAESKLDADEKAIIRQHYENLVAGMLLPEDPTSRDNARRYQGAMNSVLRSLPSPPP